MTIFRKILDSRYFIWTLLALPSIPMILALIENRPGGEGQSVYGRASSRNRRVLGQISHCRDGHLAHARSASPFSILAMDAEAPAILRRRRFLLRRVSHGFISCRYRQPSRCPRRSDRNRDLDGVAGPFRIHTPRDHVEQLFRKETRRQVETLQRGAYIAAVATVLHWIFVNDHLVPALVNFLPLAALEAIRIYRNISKPRPA